MMRVGITTPVIIEGDAVGNDVRGMAEALNRMGHAVQLFAEAWAIPEPVRSMDELSAAGLDVYIYHHSIYCGEGVRFFRDGRCRKIVKYHNITPPEFFDEGSEVRQRCTAGLRQIRDILSVACEVWADSDYNGQQMAAVRPCRYSVLPPFHQSDALAMAVTDHKFVKPYHDWNTNVVMVGRVAPNKDVVAGVETFAHFVRTNPTSRLLIVGENSGPYGDQVRRRVFELGLGEKVVLTGRVSPGELKAVYLAADALLVTSLHEGFCVPVVEAMAFGVPIVSRSSAALAETGEGVALFAETPSELAVGLRDVLEDKANRVRAGRSKYQARYQNSQIAGDLATTFSQGM